MLSQLARKLNPRYLVKLRACQNFNKLNQIQFSAMQTQLLVPSHRFGFSSETKKEKVEEAQEEPQSEQQDKKKAS